MSGDEKSWFAPIGLAGQLKVKVGLSKEEIAELEDLARALEWQVTPTEPCKCCEKIRAKKR